MLYMNEHDTIKIDLSMNKRGARQASFRYEYDKQVLRLRNDLDDDVDGDDDACMALYVIGTAPGPSNLDVYAHHPKLCKKDQWILISEFKFFVKKCVMLLVIYIYYNL